MWDKNRAQKLMNVLHYDAFAMQHIIDVDKYVGSMNSGEDLCGNYAGFCEFCSKWMQNPCVTAYYISERYKTVMPLLEATGVTEPPVVQSITDVDKYFGSEGFGCDLCGRYAPFCSVCDKGLQNPCGEAYVKYKALAGERIMVAELANNGLETSGSAPWSDAEVVAAASATGRESSRRFKIGTARRRA